MTTGYPGDAWRDRLPFRPGDPTCRHRSTTFYVPVAGGGVQATCQGCGAPRGPLERRCAAFVPSGRRCLAPARAGVLCTLHERYDDPEASR